MPLWDLLAKEDSQTVSQLVQFSCKSMREQQSQVSKCTLSWLAAASPFKMPLYRISPRPCLQLSGSRGWKSGRQGSVLPCRFAPSPRPSSQPHRVINLYPGLEPGIWNPRPDLRPCAAPSWLKSKASGLMTPPLQNNLQDTIGIQPS